jgi:uncharacterized membrane-anchored protein
MLDEKISQVVCCSTEIALMPLAKVLVGSAHLHLTWYRKSAVTKGGLTSQAARS